jgi:hypothetical protein
MNYLRKPIMQKTIRQSLMAIAVTLLLLTIGAVAMLTSPVEAATTSALNNGAYWLLEQQNEDGSWNSSAATRFRDTSESVQTLIALGETGAPIQAAAAWAQTASPENSDDLAQQILALDAAGSDTAAYVAELRGRQNSRDLGFGLDVGYLKDPLTQALAAEAMETAGYDNTDQDFLNNMGHMLFAQFGTAGWGYHADDMSRISVTSRVILALAPHDNWTIGGVSVSQKVNEGANWLKSAQNADGGWGSEGSTVADTALAMLALHGTGHTPNNLAAAENFLVNNQLGDGSWNGRVADTALAVRAIHTLVDSDPYVTPTSTAPPPTPMLPTATSMAPTPVPPTPTPIPPSDPVPPLIEDTFDRKDTLNWTWSSHQVVPFDDGGNKIVQNSGTGANWDATFYRADYNLADGQEISFRFKYDAGAHSVIGVETHEGVYNRFSIVLQNDAAEAVYYDNDGVTRTPLLSAMQSDTWYVARIHLDDRNGFTLDMYQENAPDIRGSLSAMMPIGQNWRFRNWVSSGTVYLDDYRESPAPIVTYHDTFDAKNNAVWQLNSHQTVPFNDAGNNVLRNSGTNSNYAANFHGKSYNLQSGEEVTLRFKAGSTNTNGHFSLEHRSSTMYRFGVIASNRIYVQYRDDAGWHYPGDLIPTLVAGEWYVVNLRLDDVHGFTAEVYQESDPSIRGIFTTPMPVGRDWRFRHWTYRNNVYIDDYQEWSANPPVFSETFNTQSTANWTYNTYQTVPYAFGGENVVKSDGSNSGWHGSFYRPTYNLQDGHELSIRFNSSTVNSRGHFSIESRDGGLYNRFGIVMYSSQALRVQYRDDSNVWKTSAPLIDAVQPNTWYVVRIRLDDRHGFIGEVYEEANPANGGAFSVPMPAGKNWRFIHWMYRDTIYLDDYQERFFNPPAFIETFDTQSDNDWTYATAHQTVPFSLADENVVKSVGTGANWNGQFYRSSYNLQDGDEVEIRFNTSTSDSEGHFSIDTHDGGTYNRFGVRIQDGDLVLQYKNNTSGYVKAAVLIPNVQPDTWYVVRIRLDDTYGFVGEVVEEANPANGGSYSIAMPAGKNWRFHHWIRKDTIYLDDYEERSFR